MNNQTLRSRRRPSAGSEEFHCRDEILTAKNFYWGSSAKAALIAEAVLQLLGFYAMGKTVYFAFKMNYYGSGLKDLQADTHHQYC